MRPSGPRRRGLQDLNLHAATPHVGLEPTADGRDFAVSTRYLGDMSDSSIYEAVKSKLITHGVDRTVDGRRTLNDARLFSLFVQLERVKRMASFDGVLEVCAEIEAYLTLLEKRQLIVFAYMYLSFSDLTPRKRECDVTLQDGAVRKSIIFDRAISDEEQLIGLWASVKYRSVGDHLLRQVYANG